MIVAADPDDIDDVYALWQELLDLHQSHHPIFRCKPDSEQALRNELLLRLKDKDTRIFGYVQQDEWRGMVVASIKKTVPGFRLSHKGYIAETIIKEKFRRQGIGNELVEAAKNWLTDKGADHIELQVSVRNPAAMRFWEKQGFAPTTQHMVLVVPSGTRKS